MKGYVNLTHTNNSAIEKVSQKVDEIQDDYVTKDTTELTNYYTKNQTYTKEEVDNKTANVYRAKGSVQTYQDLPTTNNQVGDVYNVIEAYEDYPAGTNFVWTDTSTWDALGGEISVIQGVSQEDFDALVNNKTLIKSSNGNFKAGLSAVGFGISIGKEASSKGDYQSIAIGDTSECDGLAGTSVGAKANAGSTYSVAIGYQARVASIYAGGIQLGRGTNTIADSLQIQDDNIYKTDTHTLTVQNAEINGTPAYGVLSGTSAPTTTTVGAVGQFYLDTTNKQLYQCMSINQTTVDNVNINEYEWKLINDNGTIVNIDNVKQSTINFDSDPQTQLNNKVDKVQGKGLSTNDFSNADKDKLNNTLSKIGGETGRSFVLSSNGKNFYSHTTAGTVIGTSNEALTLRGMSSNPTYIDDDNNVQNIVLQRDLLNKIYPIGSIYMSVNQISPASFLGGTWTPLEAGRTLWTTTTAGQGGTPLEAGLPNIMGLVEAVITTTHGGALVSASLVNNNTFDYFDHDSGGGWGQARLLGFDASMSNSIYGNSTTVQPPAIRVYMWRRTA